MLKSKGLLGKRETAERLSPRALSNVAGVGRNVVDKDGLDRQLYSQGSTVRSRDLEESGENAAGKLSVHM